MRLILIAIVAMMLSGCGNKTLADIINKHDDFINEMVHKADWNRSNGKPKDFILVIKHVDEGIVYTPSFVVHPIGRNEDYQQDMEMIVINKDGLTER